MYSPTRRTVSGQFSLITISPILQNILSNKKSLCYKCSTVLMPPELLLVELVQQCGQDLESFLHGRERTVLIVSMVDTAVTIATYLGREGGKGWEGRRVREGGEEGINDLLHYKPAVFRVDPPVCQTLPP